MFSRRVLGSCRAIPKVHPVQGASRRLATVAETETPASTSTVPPVTTGSAQQATTQNAAERTGIIHTGIVLNRHPILTRTPTKFERAYYAYESRIERALHNPFPYEFYFRPGSLLEGKFKKEERERERKAFGYAPPRRSKANDAVLTPDAVSTEEPLQIMPRRSEADKKGDVKSLNRMGDRNLYLVVMNKENGKDVWKFPQTELSGEELLHEAVKRDLRSPYALNMDTWVVSRIPVGVYKPPSANPSGKDSYVFFYKAHILQGQVRPDGKSVLDFAWLTKQEIQAKVDENYWHGVRDILSDF
ncbi:hypothetical protein NM688_g8244 [Phlebia brevispora]|uniref:Uncharacterized protein n=1 Tax=Phlebia brevispora TaxID=194682 RepID=A0ACC1RVJ5_9APHY|nr:hypothetical protein NM688_g8244 [Phlebia brevispora]